MQDYKEFSEEFYLALHSWLVDIVGGSHGIRDEGMLDSALHTPFQSFGGYDLYPTIQQKAARLWYGLVEDHPFIDGNKRIGAHAMLMFLGFNGIGLRYTQGELIDVTMSIATGDIGQDEIVEWICAHQN